MLRLGALADAAPELAEGGVGMTDVAEDRVVVVHARMRVGLPAERQTPKTW